ncbi:MAG: hypothetical protein GY950_19335 [bacterium]|nr:hypothetical protein [bacterium]
MLIFSTRKISDLLYNSQRMLEVASKDEDIKAALLAANYEEAKITALKGDWSTADTKVKEYNAAVTKQKEAKIDLDNVHEESNDIYKKHILFARSICRNDPERWARLRLSEHRGRRFNDWLLQSTDFYAQVIPDTDLIASFTEKFGVTVTELGAGKQGILNTNTKKEAHNTAIGNAQALKVERDRALLTLDKGIKDLAIVCKYALKDNPQQLEKLRIRVYSAGYKKKTKEKEPGTPEPNEPPAVSEPPTTGGTGGTEEPVPVEPEPPAEIPAEATG